MKHKNWTEKELNREYELACWRIENCKGSEVEKHKKEAEKISDYREIIRRAKRLAKGTQE